MSDFWMFQLRPGLWIMQQVHVTKILWEGRGGSCTPSCCSNFPQGTRARFLSLMLVTPVPPLSRILNQVREKVVVKGRRDKEGWRWWWKESGKQTHSHTGREGEREGEGEMDRGCWRYRATKGIFFFFFTLNHFQINFSNSGTESP